MTTTVSTNEADYARVRPTTHTVTYYHASVEIMTGLPDHGQSISYINCDHNHLTPEAADECGRSLARSAHRRVI